MKMSHVSISVKNLSESLEFYHNVVGLPVKRRFSAGESEIVFLGDGETEIELIYNQAQTDIFIGQHISIGFEVESLQDIIPALLEKGIPTGEIMQPNPQVMFFFISDPNGVRVQFLEYVK